VGGSEGKHLLGDIQVEQNEEVGVDDVIFLPHHHTSCMHYSVEEAPGGTR